MAGRYGTGGDFRVEGVGLAAQPAVATVGAQDLDDAEIAESDGEGQAGAVGAGPFDGEGQFPAEGGGPVQELDVAGPVGSERAGVERGPMSSRAAATWMYLYVSTPIATRRCPATGVMLLVAELQRYAGSGMRRWRSAGRYCDEVLGDISLLSGPAHPASTTNGPPSSACSATLASPGWCAAPTLPLWRPRSPTCTRSTPARSTPGSAWHCRAPWSASPTAPGHWPWSTCTSGAPWYPFSPLAGERWDNPQELPVAEVLAPTCGQNRTPRTVSRSTGHPAFWPGLGSVGARTGPPFRGRPSLLAPVSP